MRKGFLSDSITSVSLLTTRMTADYLSRYCVKDFNRYWEVEASYNTPGNFSCDNYTGHSSELDITAMDTYYFDQADTIGLYGKIGVDHTWVSANGISDIRTGVGYGFGLRCHPTKQIEALINLQYYGTGSSNLYYNHNSASILGVAYHL